MTRSILCLWVIFIAGGLRPPSLEAAGPTVAELLQRTDDLMRGNSSEGTFTMHVKTARWDRSMTMKVWSEGTEKSLIQILLWQS